MSHLVRVLFVEVTVDKAGWRDFVDFQSVLLSHVPRVGEGLRLHDSDEKGEGYVREVSWSIPKHAPPFHQQSCSVYFDRGQSC